MKNSISGSHRQVSWTDTFAYALPALSLAVIGIPVYVYLPKFYTDTIGVNIATVGALLMVVRLFDAVTDPVIGYVSDRTTGRFGRRKPYIAFGALGLAAAILFLFKPPVLAAGAMTLYFGFWLFALFFFWTLITIPYESLGPEMTTDYHERTMLFSIRDGFLILGTLLAAATPVLIDAVMTSFGRPPTEKERFSIMAYLFAPTIVVFSLICICRIKEKFNRPMTDHLIKGFSDVVKNRSFMILIAGYTISALGSNLPATLILYYVEYVLQARNAEIFLLIYFVTGVAFLPLWIAVSRKTGKKSAWILSMVINTGAFSGVFFLGPGDAAIYGVLVFLSGIGFGAGLALPSAIQADVIDYDELLTGQRREGRYIGLWSIAKKLAAALGIGIGLLLLGRTGYRPNAAQTASTVLTLKVLYALVPCLCNILSIAIIRFYPISEKEHARIRSKIERRQQSP
ncbi:MAG: MFS transporter [Desulfotignum sp.]|nr:MFS transporter [Desulfotignum sp.]MCF8137080.1 MFS transporter [Desulfotignum sp.]